MQYPLRAFGIDFRRCVTLLRLADGRVVIHSSAPFTAEDVAAIRRFGVPSWLVEATLMHDTFARRVRAVFPDIPYLAPDGFAKLTGVPTRSLYPPPSDWAGEIEVLKIEGLRKINEHALLSSGIAHARAGRLAFPFPRGFAWLAPVLCPAHHASAAVVWD